MPFRFRCYKNAYYEHNIPQTKNPSARFSFCVWIQTDPYFSVDVRLSVLNFVLSLYRRSSSSAPVEFSRHPRVWESFTIMPWQEQQLLKKMMIAAWMQHPLNLGLLLGETERGKWRLEWGRWTRGFWKLQSKREREGEGRGRCTGEGGGSALQPL